MLYCSLRRCAGLRVLQQVCTLEDTEPPHCVVSGPILYLHPDLATLVMTCSIYSWPPRSGCAEPNVSQCAVQKRSKDASEAAGDEDEDERDARHESAAAGLFRSVVSEATGGRVGPPPDAPPKWACRDIPP